MHNADTHGANGSVWKVEEVIFNQSDQSAAFYPDFALCGFFDAKIGTLGPGKKLAPCEIDEPVACRICTPPTARAAVLYVRSDERDRLTVRLTAADGTLLSETGVEIRGASGPPFGGPYNVPLTAGYAQIAVDRLLPSMNSSAIRIVVEGGADAEYWTFVSVTSNSAQRVTVFTPSP